MSVLPSIQSLRAVLKSPALLVQQYPSLRRLAEHNGHLPAELANPSPADAWLLLALGLGVDADVARQGAERLREDSAENPAVLDEMEAMLEFAFKDPDAAYLTWLQCHVRRIEHTLDEPWRQAA